MERTDVQPGQALAGFALCPDDHFTPDTHGSLQPARLIVTQIPPRATQGLRK